MGTITERTQIFTPAQVEILNSMAHLHTEEDLHELKRTLSHFFFERADREMERLWNEGTINEQTLEEWGKEHLRTPYRTETSGRS